MSDDLSPPPPFPPTSATPLHGSAVAAVAAAARPTERRPVEPIPEQEAKVGKAEKQPEPKKAEADDKTEAEKLEKRVASRAALQQEKARALFEKYGLTLEPHEWATPSTADRVERVQKPIRMRVHRTCHRCQTTFGVDKVCVQCGHKRCKTCPRYPVKKPKHAQQEPGKVAAVAVAGAGAGERDGPTRDERRLKAERKYRITMPAKVQTQDRVRRDVRQRVHRTCHRCERQFERGEKTCAACSHIRCTKCPRDPYVSLSLSLSLSLSSLATSPLLDVSSERVRPFADGETFRAKPHKYPDGYPGDAEALETDEIIPAVKRREFKKTRMVVKWHCHGCDGIFTHGNKTCRFCQHERCRECRRVPYVGPGGSLAVPSSSPSVVPKNLPVPTPLTPLSSSLVPRKPNRRRPSQSRSSWSASRRDWPTCVSNPVETKMQQRPRG